ncbi:LCP family protein [Lysinimonas soli]|uniref:LCP family protein n=1 Tax=Lysinimonas soli TaxID=1074233 RepID=A0ABW0NVG1_9MICO
MSRADRSASGRRRADRPYPVARHGRLRRRGPAGAIVRTIALALAVVLISTVSVAAIAVTRLTGSIQSGVHLQHIDGATAPPGVAAITGGVNLLLVGTDTRTGQGGEFGTKDQLAGSSGAGNNDVTILLHIAQDHRSAMVVSFPRDLILNLPACPAANGGRYPASSNRMLNSSLARGGLACPVLTIEKLTGVTIPYAASISFDGVAAMSDAVGGVTVCVANSINDPYVGLTLSAGEHTIQGSTALAFVRSRHGVGDGSDLGRISSQEVFLSALARKIESDGVLKNPLELYGLAQAAVENMQLSDTLGRLDTMVSIALALKSVPLENIVMIQYPTTTSPAFPNRVVPVPSLDAAVNRALVQDLAVQLTGTTGRGAIVSTQPPAAIATPTPTAAATPTVGKGKGGITPSPTPTVATPLTALPAAITGQSASEQTCAKGSGK